MMTMRQGLVIVVALIGLAGGYAVATYFAQAKYAREASAAEEASARELAGIHDAAEVWAEAMGQAQGEGIARAFAAGISPAVGAGRTEQIDGAALGLLRIPGVVGVHVLGADAGFLYSSDAKLSTTGDAGSRGAWALSVAAPVSQPSPRSGAIDIAVPITSSEGQKLAVVWLEFDLAGVQGSGRPPSEEAAISSGTGSAMPPE